MYIEVVQKISSTSDIDNHVWHVMLELPDELFRLNRKCYEAPRSAVSSQLLAESHVVLQY